LAVVNVQKGKRYRFRVLSMSCEPSFNFAIDGHEMTVIEADGELTKPVVVDNIQIHVGQRYSVVVKANQPVGNYWIRSNPDQRALPGFENKRNLAILRYAGAPVADPGPVPSNHTSTSRPLKEVDLHALIHPVVPGNPWLGGADVNMNIPFDLDLKAFKFTMNGVPYVAPTLPVLLQILSGVRNAQELLPKGSVFALPRNKVIELSIPGKGLETGGPVSEQICDFVYSLIMEHLNQHPFHMHGVSA
jgi:iron transport multicopper oxidase